MPDVTTHRVQFFLHLYFPHAPRYRWSKSISAIHRGGKGACDRKVAQVKAHVRSFANEGNSVTSPSEFKIAIESQGGIPRVRVVVVKVDRTNTKTFKLDDVNAFNNFVFDGHGFNAFKAYQVGPGKIFLWEEFHEGKHIHIISRIFISSSFISLIPLKVP